MAICSLWLQLAEGAKGTLWGHFYESTNPIHEGSFMTYQLPKAPPPHTVTLGIETEHTNLVGGGE